MTVREQQGQYGHEASLKAKGVVRVYLTRNTRIAPHADLQFRSLRGTPELARALRKSEIDVTNSTAFTLDKELSEIEEIGYELGVLNQYLLEYEFMPTYKVRSNQSFPKKVRFDPETERTLEQAGPDVVAFIEEEVNHILSEEWGEWDEKRITLTRYGLFQITLEKRITELTLITDILENVLRLQQEFDLPELLEHKITSLTEELIQVQKDLDSAAREASKHHHLFRHNISVEDQLAHDPIWIKLHERQQAIPKEIKNHQELKEKLGTSVNNTLDPSVQWEIARELIEQYIDSLCNVLHVEERRKRRLFPQTIRIPFYEKPVSAFTRGVSYPFRTQYVVFEFEQLARTEKGEEITVTVDDQEAKEELASLLESVQLLRPDKPSVWSPTKDDFAKRLFSTDASTWKDELCIFSGDNALICHHYPPQELTIGPSFPRPVRYTDYWAAVVRGIAYVAELRTITKLLENETSDDLERTSDYRHRLHIRMAEKVRRDMKDIALRVAAASLLVARLRNASMPSTMANADYAALKFRRLLDRFEVHTSLDHSHQNVEQLNDLLSHYDDLLANKTNLLVAIVLSIVTVALPILALPPYIKYVTGSEEFSPDLTKHLLGWLFGTESLNAAVWIGCILTLIVFAFGIIGVVSSFRVLLWIRFNWIRELGVRYQVRQDNQMKSKRNKRTI